LIFGKYHLSLKSPAGILIPLIIIGFIFAYLYESKHLFFDQSMLLVRNVIFLIIILLIFVLIDEIKIKKITSEKRLEKEIIINKISLSTETKKNIFFIAFLFIYLFSIKFLGFLISTVLFLIITMYFLGIRNKKILFLFPIIFIIIIFLFFNLWLMVPLPVGIFGI